MNITKQALEIDLDRLVQTAKLLGSTQATKAFGYYSQTDSIFERSFNEIIEDVKRSLIESLDSKNLEYPVSTDTKTVNSLTNYVAEPVLDYTVLYEYAKSDRISYNRLCTMVRKSISTRKPLPTPKNIEPVTVDIAIRCLEDLAYYASIDSAVNAQGPVATLKAFIQSVAPLLQLRNPK